MKAKELLQTALNNLLIVQEEELDLTIEEAMDLNGALERIWDLVKTLEAKETVSGADIAVADMIIEACHQ